MLTCARCEARHETIGALAAHIAYAHVLPDDRAMAEAQRVAGSCPGCGRTSGAHNKACPHTEWKPAPPPDRPSARPAARAVAVVADLPAMQRVAQEGLRAAHEATRARELDLLMLDKPAPKETPMPTHSHKADPAACKLCARLTKKAGEPTKCKWHGGAGVKKASGGGKRKAKPRAAKRGRIVRDPGPPNGHVVDLKDNVARATAQTLLGQLVALRGRLDEKIVHVRELAEIL